MEKLLKTEIVNILNQIQRKNAPVLVDNQIIPTYEETSEHRFDLVDAKQGTIIRDFDTGTAHYINGNQDDTYPLKIICYDDFIHQFTFEDKNGHSRVSRLKDGVKVADFLIYEKSESKVVFIVHEVSKENPSTKIRTAKKQLSDTLNQLYKSEVIGDFIDSFREKICYLSAMDDRKIVPSEGMADGFAQIYEVLPEPSSFTYGQIGTHGFSAFETSYVSLTKDPVEPTCK